jgi:short chain dehydrogenase
MGTSFHSTVPRCTSRWTGLQSGRSARGSSQRDIAAVAAHWEELAARGGTPAASRRLGRLRVRRQALASWARLVTQPEPVTRTVEEVTGVPTHTFPQWVYDQIEDFHPTETWPDSSSCSSGTRTFRPGRLLRAGCHRGRGSKTWVARHLRTAGPPDPRRRRGPGRVAIVTEGYSGLGLETTRALLSAGAKVTVPARQHNRAASALDGLDDVQIEALDLMDAASIDAFAERFLASGLPLHMLVNSAGIMAAPLVRNARGYESQFATNHLGHFQLVARLWPTLRRTNGARVVSVSSWGHRFSPIVFEEPNFERRDYDRWSAYGQSETANIPVRASA